MTSTVRQQYLKHLPKLNQVLEYMQHTLSDLPSGEFVFESNLKPYKSVKRKMLTDKVKHPLKLSDLVRGRIFFSSNFEMPEVVTLIKQLLGPHLIQTDKKGGRQENGLQVKGVTHMDFNINGEKVNGTARKDTSWPNHDQSRGNSLALCAETL